jgi:hypothetical protein
MAEARNRVPLFDSGRFVRNLEQAYETMWRRFNSSQAPGAFAVENHVPAG